METQTRLRVRAGVFFFFLAAAALTGCSHKQADTGGGLPAQATPAQVQANIQQQAAARAAFYSSHPGAHP